MPSKLSPRQELLKIQKKIFARNESFILSQALVRERNFDRYERQYKRRVHTYSQVSSQEELLKAILESDIIYVGDYHTNKQSQRTLLRLLKLVLEKDKSIGVALELVQKRHQKILNGYLEEKISEETFLKKIQFRKYWYFDLWQNFKPIFDFARFHQLPLYAVEKSLSDNASLGVRDQRNSEIIASLIQNHPDQRLVVFVGDLHIAPEHLPQDTERVLKERGIQKKALILYQNCESIYWQLAEEELEDHVEIVRIRENEFCIINTPPIIWQQSYLNWIEHEEESIDYADARHSFLEIIKQIAEFLGLELSPMSDEVEVFTCGDLSFLKRLSEDSDFSKKDIRRIKKQILASESYCIPQKKYVYLANLSLNHAAEEAAHFLKFLCSGAEEERTSVDAFYANILHEALGFFGSKIINHKRKCFHEREYLGLINYLKSKGFPKNRNLELEIAMLVLKHRELDKKGTPIRSKRYFMGRHELFFGVTHGLGYMLGDRLYYALMQDRITKDEIRELFCNPMKEEGMTYEVYKKLLRKIRGIKIPKRV